MIQPKAATKVSAQNGVGAANFTATVYGSIFSTTTSLEEPLGTAAVAGSRAYSQVNTQSSAVNGLPSCQVTFFFSFQITDLPSAARVPSSRPGTVSARIGRRLPSASQPASGS